MGSARGMTVIRRSRGWHAPRPTFPGRRKQRLASVRRRPRAWFRLPGDISISLPNWRWAPWYEPPRPRRHVALRILDGVAYLATGWLLLRPWLKRLGANQAELRRTYPGDELYGHSDVTTRAITIEARASDIWPWIVQMGYGRGGWYAVDLLDNRGRSSAREILPEYQQLQVGDAVPSGPRSAFRVHDIEPERFLVLTYDGSFGASSWLFWLEPIDDHRTRLVERIRGHASSNPIVELTKLLGDAGDVVMMLAQLRNLKRRGERSANERRAREVAAGPGIGEDEPPTGAPSEEAPSASA